MSKSTLEGKVKEQIKEHLATHCISWQYWPVSMGMGTHGIPDCVACVEGRLVGIEVKAPGLRGRKNRGASGLQMMQLRKIRDAWGYAAIIDSLQELKEFLDFVDAGVRYDFENFIKNKG